VGTNIVSYASTDGHNWVGTGITSLTDQKPDMFVGPSLSVETGNIWAAADFDVFGPTDPNCASSQCTFNATYDRLWVAEFRNFVDVGSTQISITKVAGVPTITFTGILQRASIVSGPYADVAGATSPYSVPAGPTSGYFRVRGTITSK